LRSFFFFFYCVCWYIAADPGYPAVPSLKSLNFNAPDDPAGDKRHTQEVNELAQHFLFFFFFFFW
jgi:hypothetical protein